MENNRFFSPENILSLLEKLSVYLNRYVFETKTGFTGVYIIFLISAQKLDSGYLLEPR